MAIESILIGARPNDKTGDSLRDGAIKINSNFTELDQRTNTIVSGSDQVSGSFVNITGDTMTGDLIIDGALQMTKGIDTIDYAIFDTTPENVSSAQGTLQWNMDEHTLDLIQNGTTLQLGQEQQYCTLNNSGQTIPDGTAVMIMGTTGNSGKILIVPMDGSLISNTKRFLGITTEETPNGSTGKVTTFGKIRNIDTRGQNGETWSNGDILYIHASIHGALTNIEPTTEHISMPVAFVINAASNGVLFTRVTNVNKHEFVSVDEDTTIYAELTISGSLIINNVPPTSSIDIGRQNEIRFDSDYIYVCIATNTWKRSPLTSW